MKCDSERNYNININLHGDKLLIEILQASNVLKIWKLESNITDESNIVETLITIMQKNQIGGSCNAFIAKLQQLSEPRQELPKQENSKLSNYLRFLISYNK